MEPFSFHVSYFNAQLYMFFACTCLKAVGVKKWANFVVRLSVRCKELEILTEA